MGRRVSVQIWQGAQAPEAYQLVLTPDAVGGADLSTVTAAEFLVKSPAPENIETTWAATFVYVASPSPKLTITHVFAVSPAASELTRPGTWTAFAKLTTASGPLRSQPRPIFVRGKFEITSDY